MTAETFKADPLRDISGRLWEVERKLHVAQKGVLRAMGLCAPDSSTPAAHAYERGRALGSAHKNIGDALELIHDAQEVIAPVLSSPASNAITSTEKKPT